MANLIPQKAPQLNIQNNSRVNFVRIRRQAENLLAR